MCRPSGAPHHYSRLPRAHALGYLLNAPPALRGQKKRKGGAPGTHGIAEDRKKRKAGAPRLIETMTGPEAFLLDLPHRIPPFAKTKTAKNGAPGNKAPTSHRVNQA